MTATRIKWYDSYGVTTGWEDISSFTANPLVIESIGFVVFENESVLALASNYADETEHTPKQANGVMTIPKCCITERIDL